MSQSITMVQYRDSEGRVRTETSQPGSSVNILIYDRVSGVRYQLDPVKKSAVKRAVGAVVPAPAMTVADAVRNGPNVIEEDLGAMSVNGVAARGTRFGA